MVTASTNRKPQSQKEYWERTQLTHRRNPAHPVIKSFALSKIRQIRKFVDLDETTRLLDVGAGNGFFSFYLDQICKVTATDLSETMISMNPVKKKMVMDAASLTFEDNSFDVVFACSLLHHVSEPADVIGEMKRVSSKTVILIEPNRTNPLVYLFCLCVREERAALKFSLSYVKELLLKSGLKVVKALSHGIIAPNKTPEFLLPIIRFFDVKIPFLGFDNIFICEK